MGRTHKQPSGRALLNALKDENFDMHIEAALALGGRGDERAIEPLIHALKDGRTREAAREALVRLGTPAVLRLVKALRRGGVCWLAATTLRQFKVGQVIEPLIDALNGRNKQVCRYAAEILGKLGDRRSGAPLIEALSD